MGTTQVEDTGLWSMVPSLYVFYCLWLNHDGVGSISLKSKDPLEDPVVVSGETRRQWSKQSFSQSGNELSCHATAGQYADGLPAARLSVGYTGYLKTGFDEMKLVRLYRMLYDWASTMRRKLGIDLVQLSGE